jgi:plasmid replication initiation protein
MTKSKEPKEHYVIRKNNALIEARYRLSIAEQRIILMLAACVQPDDGGLSSFRFKVSDLLQLIGTQGGGNKYKAVHDTIYQLMQRVLKIKQHNGDYSLFNWLGSAHYYHGEGEFELRFDEGLRPYLLGLNKQYRAYQLGNLIQLKSKYSVRLYELLKQYEKIGKRYFEIEELRLALGIEEGEYVLSKNFKNRVLEPAAKELPKKTDLKFSYKRRMRARRIVGYDFKISASKTAPVPVTRSRIPKESTGQQSLSFPPTIIERGSSEQREGLTAIGDILANLS